MVAGPAWRVLLASPGFLTRCVVTEPGITTVLITNPSNGVLHAGDEVRRFYMQVLANTPEYRVMALSVP
jgi:hypothetical protein